MDEVLRQIARAVHHDSDTHRRPLRLLRCLSCERYRKTAPPRRPEVELVPGTDRPDGGRTDPDRWQRRRTALNDIARASDAARHVGRRTMGMWLCTIRRPHARASSRETCRCALVL
ncbi:hypothetical protein XAC3509 [Xanthomonas citri pv. citri str. 306]|uniref:Uncharacterized protein n=1 Tax=Xanthomonas axonopodis pv. citri (strain 306) TaxID=190486 RepID=A0AAI8ET07_XANAC|nr:hypothetical protein XAC3509 [Xanthomonas citri pv. citri str. 306]